MRCSRCDETIIPFYNHMTEQDEYVCPCTEKHEEPEPRKREEVKTQNCKICGRNQCLKGEICAGCDELIKEMV